jgi:putative ABC transport system permease protein
MSWRSRLANVFRPNRLAIDLDDELAFHVAERIDELVAAGLSPEDARAEALRRFGNYPLQRDRTRDMDVIRPLESLLSDLRYGARQLRVNPGFATVAILSLALGIGANTAIFQLIDALRLRSLPVERPWELATIDTDQGFYSAGWYAGRHTAFTYAQFKEFQRQQRAFSRLLAFGTARFNLARSGEAQYAQGLYVSANFLDVLGVRPTLGSGLGPEGDAPTCGRAGALLSYAFWERTYGGDPAAVGRDIYLEGRMFPIIGVTPPSFFGLEPGRQFDVALPICADALLSTDGKGRPARLDAWWLSLVGRLHPGWTLERATAHLHQISPAVFRQTLPPEYRPAETAQYLKNRVKAIDASAGLSTLREQYENPLWLLLAVTALVLLIACANLANLLLARASARQREMAVRQAMGASRLRLAVQLTSESLLLAALGAALALVVAQAISGLLVAFLSDPDQPIVLALGLDWHVFGFTALVALLTCLLFGIGPAIKAAGQAPVTAMQGGRGTTGTPERHRFRRALVVAQVALSLVLLVGALLFGQTLRNLLRIDPGIAPEGVLVAGVDARLPRLAPEHRRVVFDELQERIAAQPGVQSVAQVFLSPFSGNGWNDTVHGEGRDASTEGKLSWFNRVGPGYFRTLKTAVLAGRDFGRGDTADAPRVAIVNEEFARIFLGGRNPVGRTFRVEAGAGKPEPVYQIVGLVKNTKYNGLREESRPIAFLPVAQDEDYPDELTFLVRSQAPLGTTMAGIRRVMNDLQSGMLVEFRVLELQVARSVQRERLMASVSGAFGILAALLSTLGLYGVMSYMVARRRNEIGVRVALGASARDVIRLVLSEAGRLVVVGLVIGAVSAFVLARYAESLLFGLKPGDAATLMFACLLLSMTAAVACLLPARRALKLDPAAVLREE